MKHQLRLLIVNAKKIIEIGCHQTKSWFRQAILGIYKLLHWLLATLWAGWRWAKAHPFKLLVISFLLPWTLLGVSIIICYLWVEIQTQGRLYTKVEDIPAKKVALLLGTVKHLRHGRINRYFQYRINAVVQLYKAGKIKHIIASGDNHTKYYNEPIEMKKSLLAQDIPSEAITLDYAGFRTLDSIVRCKKVFSQNEIIVVSQAFHNKRALFIGDFYGMKAIGFNARGVAWREDLKTPLREYLARLKAVLDLYVLGTQPKFLGKKIEI